MISDCPIASAPIAAGLDASTSGPVSVHVSAPVLVVYGPATGAVHAPVSLRVLGYGAVTAPLRLVLADDQPARSWDARIILGGVDITARVLGEISIEAEEDAARLATFRVLPVAQYDPLVYSGPDVTIDYLADGIAHRLFTGRADLPEYDPSTGIVTVNCTDDRANLLAALPLTTIDALIGGTYSQSIHGEIDDHYAYAMARLSTVPASLDLSAYGAARVTSWDGRPTIMSITRPLDDTVAVTLPERSSLRNKVVASLQYRYTRLRDRRAVIGWSAPNALSSTMQQLGWQYPTTSMLDSAASGAGWTVYWQSYSPAPSRVSVDIGGETHYMDIDADRVGSYVARLAQRHAQTITESHTLTVTAPRSIEANGALIAETSGTIASEWDGSAWESDLTALPAIQAGEIDWAPDVPRSATPAGISASGWLAGAAVGGGPWYAEAITQDECSGVVNRITVRDTFDNACATMLYMAQRTILASHRGGRVSLAIPIEPALDLVHALDINTGRVEAIGKVRRLRHVLGLDTASATTDVEIAISGAGGVGIVDPTDLIPPAQPDTGIQAQDWQSQLPALHTWVGGEVAYSDALSGWLVNCPETFQMYVLNGTDRAYRTVTSTGYTPDGLPVTGFRVDMPGVSTCNRNAAEVEALANYTIDIPDDIITLGH